MKDQPFTWKTEMTIATIGLLIAVVALYAVYLHKPA
jgi:hypothetical protein